MLELLSYTKSKAHRSIKSAHRIYIKDNVGRQYFDSMSGLWCVSLGYSNKNIKQSISNQLNQLPYGSNFYRATHNITEKFIKKIKPYLRHYSFVYFANSGSMSCELAYRLSNYFFNSKKKTGIGYIKYSYHGTSFIPSLFSNQDMISFGSPSRFNKRYCIDIKDNNGTIEESYLLNQIKILFKKNHDKICLFILEPVIGAGGIYKIKKSTLKSVKKLCNQYNVLLAFDEVVTGFGKMGKMFYTQGLGADFLIAGKGITNGYLPLSATFIGNKIVSRIDKFNFGVTFSSHPVALSAGIANIKELENLLLRKPPIFDFKILKQEVKNIKNIKNIRQFGCMGAIEFQSQELAKKAVIYSWKKGFILSRASNNSCSVCWCLPLICTSKELFLFKKLLLNLLKEI